MYYIVQCEIQNVIIVWKYYIIWNKHCCYIQHTHKFLFSFWCWGLRLKNKWRLMSILKDMRCLHHARDDKTSFSVVPNLQQINFYFWKYKKKMHGVFCLLFSLYFTSYFAQYLKISLADIRYLLLWCITYYCNSMNSELWSES